MHIFTRSAIGNLLLPFCSSGATDLLGITVQLPAPLTSAVTAIANVVEQPNVRCL